MQLARVHSNTLSQSLFLGKALPSHDSGLSLTINEKERRLQQIQLYVYVLELLYSVLQLTQEMLKEGRVIPSRPLIRGQPLCLVDLWALFSFECLSCAFLYGDLFWYWLDPQQMNLECYCLTYASAFEMLIFRVFHVLFQTVYTAFLLLHVILVVVPA